MAKVWFVREGSYPTNGAPAYGAPAYNISLQQCIDQLGLTKNDWLHGLNLKLRFGSRTTEPAAVPDPRHVVCQVDDPEASEHGWGTGYYVLGISPNEVVERLERPEAS